MSATPPTEAPQLTAEGADLLRDVLAKRSVDTRWDVDRKDPTEHPKPEETATRQHTRRRGRSGPLAALAVVLVGGIIGLSSTLFTNTDTTSPGTQPDRDAATVPTEVGGATLVSPTTTTADAVASTTELETEVAGDASSIDDEPVLSVLPNEPPPDDLTLTVYSSSSEESASSFAIRVAQRDGIELATTGFGAYLEMNGAVVPAELRFEQAELPANGSAVAAVRVSTTISGPAELVVLWAGEEVARSLIDLHSS